MFRAHVEDLLSVLPSDLPVGLYECPAPFRRLLSEEEVSYCAQSGRFTFLKDVSCDLAVVKHRLELTRGTPLGINNANAAIAWPAMQAGASGFCGVMSNFHPDLYRWIQDHGADHPDLAEDLATFMVLAAMSEAFGYPKLAKHYHVRRGTCPFACDHSRVRCPTTSMSGSGRWTSFSTGWTRAPSTSRAASRKASLAHRSRRRHSA